MNAPFTPIFFKVKLGCTGLFLFLLKNIDCGYWLELLWRGGSIYVLSKKKLKTANDMLLIKLSGPVIINIFKQ